MLNIASVVTTVVTVRLRHQRRREKIKLKLEKVAINDALPHIRLPDVMPLPS